MPTYAVTGASGKLGRLAIVELLDRGVRPSEIVALVRQTRNAADLADRGVELREADYASPGTLSEALTGIDRLLLVSSSAQGQRVLHHANIIGAARTAAVSRVVYTSMLNLDDSTSPLADEHRATERVLRESGIQYTLLRNGWYTENYIDHLEQYIATGEIVAAAGTGRISAATRTDLAAAAAAALLDDHDGNKVYELGGDAFDLYELAQVISQVAGKPVTYTELTTADYVARLRSGGMDESTARFIADLDVSLARGDLETGRDDLADLLGRRPTPPSQVIAAAAADTRT